MKAIKGEISLLRIFKFFGFRKDAIHIDDVTFEIPSMYQSHIQTLITNVSPTEYGYNIVVIDDMKNQTYKYLEDNIKFKKNCSAVEEVYIRLLVNNVPPIYSVTNRLFSYVDGVLYFNGLDDIALERTRKLKELGI